MLEFFVHVLTSVIVVVPLWRLFARAGLNRYLALLAFLPLGVIVALFVLAFARWSPHAEEQY